MLMDGWGNPLRFSLSSDGVITLTSYGWDGKPGGSGWNADVSMSFYTRHPDGTWWIGSDGWILQARRTYF